MSKKETIQEFLTRGGEIKKFAEEQRIESIKTMSTAIGGPAVLMTYADAGLYYGEGKQRKPKKKKVQVKIDLNALPDAIKNKYCKELIDGLEE